MRVAVTYTDKENKLLQDVLWVLMPKVVAAKVNLVPPNINLQAHATVGQIVALHNKLFKTWSGRQIHSDSTWD
eukprot:5636583-Amphidinium_carterae.1